MSLLAYLNKLTDDLAAVLDAKATSIRERTAEHGMARYVEGYRDGYAEASRQATVQVRDMCGFLGCTEHPEHDPPHVVSDAST